MCYLTLDLVQMVGLTRTREEAQLWNDAEDEEVNR